MEYFDLALFKYLMNQVTDAVFMFDPRTLLFAYVNKGAVAQLGYSDEQLLTMRPLDIKPEYDEGAFQDLISPLVRQEKSELFFETLHRHKDGTDIPVYVSLRLLNSEDGCQRFVAVVRDRQRSQRMEMALQRSRQHKSEFQLRDELIRDQVCEHLARELHDQLGQNLAVLRNEASLIGMRFGADQPLLAEQVTSMKKNIDSMIDVVRNISSTLQPPEIALGLVPALQLMIDRLGGFTDLVYRLHINGEIDVQLSMDVRTVVYRLVQESLTNVLRHAKARNAEIILTVNKDEIFIEIGDDGQGFDPDTIDSKKTLGLMFMRERLMNLGGEMFIDAAVGCGVTLKFRIPLYRVGI